MTLAWLEKTGKEELAGALFQTYQTLRNQQEGRSQQNLYHMSLYEGRAIQDFDSYSPTDAVKPNPDDHNVCEPIVDTLVNMVATTPPRVQVLSIEGSWSDAQQAKQLGYFVSGQFRVTGYQAIRMAMAESAAIFGSGFAKIYRVGKDIHLDEIFIDDLLVDDVDGRRGRPRSLYQVAEIDRAVLRKRFPKLSVPISEASRVTRTTPDNAADLYDSVTMLEAWHLPSSPDAEDGRHVISLDKAALLDEGWTRDYFPFLVLRYKPRLLGWHGRGVVESIASTQRRINKKQSRIGEAEDLNVPVMLVPKGCNVNRKKWKNLPWIFVEYEGQPPTPMVSPSISQDIYQSLGTDKNDAFAIAGISQMVSQSMKPAGLDSGEAIRAYADITSQRFARFFTALQELDVSAFSLFVDLAQEIAEEEGDYEVIGIRERGRRQVASRVRWSQVDLARDKYIVQPFAAGYLPLTPSGKYQKAKELIQLSPAFQTAALRLLGSVPDVEAEVQLQTAPLDYIDSIAEHFLEGGDYIPPSGYYPIPMAMERFQLHLLRAELDGAPEEVLQKFRDYLLALDAQAKKTAAAASAQAMGSTGGPQLSMAGGMGNLAPRQVIPNAPAMGALF